METIANIPSKCFSQNLVEDLDIHLEECLCQESSEKWLKLEQFWGDKRHRIQEFDNLTQPLCSSLERHLLFDECLQEPEDDFENDLKDEVSFNEDSDSLIRGEDINDIPTQYTITGFKPNELIVIGTYIDKSIIPGFKYQVRKNHSEKYLFDGKATRLQQIGLGYGKRLTFESPSLNNNKNYFWSDSSAAGFGLTLSVVSQGDIFAIYDPVTRKYCGRAIVRSVKGQQIVKSIVFGKNGRIEKLVEVELICDIVIGSGNGQTLAVQETLASGIVSVVRKNHSANAEVEDIQLTNFVVKDCFLKPDN